jgi:glycine/D-amino acid oxidase-like deaminating enzyme
LVFFTALSRLTNTRFLIVGAGLSGSWLAWHLQQAEADFLVIDEPKANSASRMASGIINPVTGRRFVTTWMADTLLPFCLEQYRTVEKAFDLSLISLCPVIDFFPSTQMREAFMKRTTEADNLFLKAGANDNDWRPHLHFELGYGSIEPVYQVMVNRFLTAIRTKLQAENRLLETRFNASALEVTDNEVHYENIKAETIIFCDGIHAVQIPWFNRLPFAFNKGEMLLVRIPELPKGFIYKKGMSIVPFDGEQWWVGSTYEWEFENDQPTTAFVEKTMAWLRQFVKHDIELTGHFAALRPATVERRPFVGMHPQQPRLGLLNGMGTKGVSLAPFFAEQLAQHLLTGAAILPDADVNRYRRILSR